ncbi:PEPxxWA-CTERM sorting domain-containing protein [Phenylobacterium sp.]|uniref:PEPxxWA-CTERM sorting domain-containing protein n=1 Tax=Phenylobacterium sp. TaxID=1871053 RepID=UPI0025E596FC|nr:PEPxxWA-CTERM sorting domain-containing protein [Phenylobacterium sp.]
MRSLGYTIAAGALLMGAPALAQDVGVTVGQADSAVQQGEVVAPWGAGAGMLNINGRGGSAESIVEITTTHASFESGVAVSGKQSSAVSSSGVDVTLTNTSTYDVVAIEDFGSTIIPAGLGFYLADRTGQAIDNNIFTGYGQTLSGNTLASLFDEAGVGVFAMAGFDFAITSGDTTLYSMEGSLALSFDGDGYLHTTYNLTDASGRLNGFTTAYNNSLALAYAWDATNIVVPLNAILESGQSMSLQYRTNVYAYSDVDCVTTNVACLVAYSGFGDPIGRGGGVSLAARGMRQQQAYKPITGIVFDPQSIDPFQGIASTPVPEPATWLSMIMGFGLLGAALRRRRVLAYS